VDSPSLPFEVQIGSADDDSRVRGSLHVESHEVATIPRQDRAVTGCGDTENVEIVRAQVRQSRFAGRRGIVSEPAQSLDDLMREIFVGEQERHGSYRPCTSM
jgi:hypothetical protein